MNAVIEMESQQIAEAISEYCAKRQWRYIKHTIKIEEGDPGDSREAGYRREVVRVTVEVPTSAAGPLHPGTSEAYDRETPR